MGGAKTAGGARDACRSTGLEQFERADRRDHHRQPHPAAELLDGSIDLRDVAQHARPECDLVERHAVAAHGGLGLGGADDVVPGILVEVGAGLDDQLVQVLEFLAAGAEFDRLRRDAGRFVHGVLPGDAFALRYRVPGYRAIPKIAMAGIAGAVAPGCLTRPGKSPARFSAPCVKPLLQKYSGFPKWQISSLSRRPAPLEGRCATSRNAERDAVDAGALETRALSCGRQNRMVLTPRRWRQVPEKQVSRGRRWQESRSPGRVRISRKTIAWGVPGDSGVT